MRAPSIPARQVIEIRPNLADRLPSESQHEAFAVAGGLFAECRVVAEFIEDRIRRPASARAPAAKHGIVFEGQLHRAIAWLHSLGKLDGPADFQAVTAATRALFEGALDVTLMHFDARIRTREVGGLERSAKLKHADAVAAFLATAARPAKPDEQPILDFRHREGARTSPSWPSSARTASRATRSPRCREILR